MQSQADKKYIYPPLPCQVPGIFKRPASHPSLQVGQVCR